METPDKQSLGRIIDGIREGRYVIPDFQREFEWHASDVTELLKSIFKDYYIGTLLLWRADKKNVEDLSCESIYGFEGKCNEEHIVLDGQQRLSALHYAFFAPQKHFPKKSRRCLFFISIEELLNENYNDAIYYEWDYKKTVDLLNDKESQFKQKILPLKILSQEKYDYRDWIDEYVKYWEKNGSKTIEDEEKGLKDIIKELLQTYEMSYIELDRKIEIAKVCDIFTKINSTGINLSIFDLMNAILKPKDIQLKEMWRKVSTGFNDVMEAKNVLMTMSILKQDYCAPSYLYYLVPGSKKIIKTLSGDKKEIVLFETKDEFIDSWNFVVESLPKALKSLQNPRDFGAITATFLPYPTMIPIFTALSIEKRNDEYKDKHDINKKLKRWYWSSVFAKAYSSSVESQMAKDYQEVKKWFTNDELLPQAVIQSNLEVDNLNLMNETSQGSAIYKAIFDILIMKGAKDWVSADKPEYSNLHDHHIVPNSWGKIKVGKRINTILNRTPLSDITNRDVINDDLPNVYLKKLFDEAKDINEIYKVLESHLISRKAVEILLRENFTVDDYDEFIDEREKSIMKEIRKVIGNVSLLEENLTIDPNKVLNDLEKNLRDFLDTYFKDEFGDNYWKAAIPSHIQELIKTNIQRDINQNPAIIAINDPRKKLNYCDMSHYYPIIKNNWNIFEEIFINNHNTEKHFSQVSEYRNPEKHLREMTEVTKKLGEASIEWIFGIINPDYIKNYKNIKRKSDIINIPGLENLFSEEDLDKVDKYKEWLEEKSDVKLLDRFKDKKAFGQHKAKGKYDESWYNLIAVDKFIPIISFDKCSYYTGKPEVFICIQVEKQKYKDVIEEIRNMSEMSNWLYKKEYGEHFMMVSVSLNDQTQVKEELQKAFDVREKINNKYLKNKKDDVLQCTMEGIKAKGRYLPGNEFIVFSESGARVEEVESFKNVSGQKLRKELTRKGILKKFDNKYIFTEDYIFGSPSAASNVILGRPSNGSMEWID